MPGRSETHEFLRVRSPLFRYDYRPIFSTLTARHTGHTRASST